MKIFNSLVLWLVLLTGFNVFAIDATDNKQPEKIVVLIKNTDGSFKGVFKNASLNAVLKEISNHTKLKFFTYPKVKAIYNLEFANWSEKKLIDTIIRDLSSYRVLAKNKFTKHLILFESNTKGSKLHNIATDSKLIEFDFKKSFVSTKQSRPTNNSIYKPRKLNSHIPIATEIYNGIKVSFVADELLIRINPGNNISQQIRNLNKLVGKYNGVLADRMHRLKYFVARFPFGVDIKALKKELIKEKYITTVEANYIANLAGQQSHQTTIDISPIATTNENNAKTSFKPRIAIIDTGIDKTVTQLQNKVLDIANTVDDTANTNDDNGHGTTMALLALQAAPNAIIHAVKVMDKNGIGTYADIAQGIFHALDRKIQVINISLGGYKPSQILQDAIAYAKYKGVTVVAAVGNDGYKNKPFYPAAYANVIGVGGIDNKNQVIPQSNQGEMVDLVAPAININYQHNQQTKTTQGTSAAAALISGIVAQVSINPTRQTPSIIAGRLFETATDLLTQGKDDATGYGLANLTKALQLASPTQDYQEEFKEIDGVIPLDKAQIQILVDFVKGDITEWIELDDDFITNDSDYIAKFCPTQTDYKKIVRLKDSNGRYSISVGDFECVDDWGPDRYNEVRLYVMSGIVENLGGDSHESLSLIPNQNLLNNGNNKIASFDTIATGSKSDKHGIRGGFGYDGFEWSDTFGFDVNTKNGADEYIFTNLKEQLSTIPSHLLYAEKDYYWDVDTMSLSGSVNNNLSSKTPIIFIHGWNGIEENWADTLLQQNEVQAWWELIENNTNSKKLSFLKTPGVNIYDTYGEVNGQGSDHDSFFSSKGLSTDFKTYKFRYPTMRSNEYNAKRLSDLISSHPELRNRDDIILVGHSTGGLLAKYAMLGYGDVDSINTRVKRVITLATPHRGSYGSFDYDTDVTEDLEICNGIDSTVNLQLYNSGTNGFIKWLTGGAGNLTTDGAIDLAWDGGWGKKTPRCTSDNYQEKPLLVLGSSNDTYASNTKLQTLNNTLLASKSILSKFIFYAGWTVSSGAYNNSIAMIAAAAAIDDVDYELDGAVPLPSGLLFENNKDTESILVGYKTEAKKSSNKHYYVSGNRRIFYDRDHSQMREGVFLDNSQYSITTDPLFKQFKTDILAARAEISTPSTPSRPTASAQSTNQINLSWSSVSGASYYRLYQGGSQIYGGSNRSYNHTGLTDNTTYYYKLKACTNSNSNTCSGYSPVSSATTRDIQSAPSVPEGVSASNGTYSDKVKISWNSVSNASSYKICRTTSISSSSCSEFSDSSSPYNDSSASVGRTYYYKVKACDSAGICGGYSGKRSGFKKSTTQSPAVVAPNGVNASKGQYDNEVRISWNSISSASSYEISRSTNKNGSYSKIGVSSSNSYSDTSAETGQGYYYKIKFCISTNGNNCTSNYSGHSYGYVKFLGIHDIPSGVFSLSPCVIKYGEFTACNSYMQTVLNADNSDVNIDVDGIYGSDTRVAIRKFQTRYGLIVDGKAGLQTKAKLEVVLARLKRENPPPTPVVENDFYVSNQSLSKTPVEAGDSITARARLNYSGNQADDMKVYLGYYLSSNTTLGGSDKHLGSAYDRLSNSDKYSNESVSFNIPSDTTPGQYYILFVADYKEQYSETNENNNVAYVPLVITYSEPEPEPTPSPPTNINASAGNAQVSLSWDRISNASYKVYWHTNNNVSKSSYLGSKSVSSNNASITGLTNDTQYYFVVTTIKNSQESAASNKVNATPANVIANNPFITTWVTIEADDSISINGLETFNGVTSNYNLDCGLGGIADKTTNISGDARCTYQNPGRHTISISGNILGFDGKISRDEEKLKSIVKWGNISWKTMGEAFKNTGNFIIENGAGVPDLSQVTDMHYMFGNSQFNQDISNWDVSNITDMHEMFSGATSFNQSLSGWDVSSVTDMSDMFEDATSFNQPLNNWNVSSVTHMEDMFEDATSFNQPLNNWDVSNVTNMEGMFGRTTNFNQPLDNWDVSNVTDMSYMFGYSKFNQDISNWDVTNVTDMSSMFEGATSFNQPLNNWNVSNVTDMSDMFYGTTSFNQPLSSWDVSNVTDMGSMFRGATDFNQFLNNWDTSNVVNTGMKAMFNGATNFNQPLNNWDTSNATYMWGMFEDAISFNQSLNNWDVSNVANMVMMFRGATNFNQPLDNWDVSSVTSMWGMFRGATSFNQPLDNWNISNVNIFYGFLKGARLSTANYDKLLIAWNKLSLINAVSFDGGSSTYSQLAKSARDNLVSGSGHNWTIEDGGLVDTVYYSLAIGVNNNGVITSSPDGINCGIDCSEYFDENTSVALMANANSGYEFTNWSGSCFGVDNPLTVAVNGDKNCSANFSLIQLANPQTPSAPDANVQSSTQINLSWSAVSGASYYRLYQGDSQIYGGSNRSYNNTGLSADTTYYYKLKACVSSDSDTCSDYSSVSSATTQQAPVQYSLTIETPTNGTIDAATISLTEFRLTANADPGYEFSNWTGDCSGTSNPLTITLDSNKTCTANFIAEPVGVKTQQVYIQGGNQNISAGQEVTLTVKYNTSDNDNTLSGLNIRMHFDSSKLTIEGVSNVVGTRFINALAATGDVNDDDNDASTDSYYHLGLGDTNLSWPNQALPTTIFKAIFRANESLAANTTTRINFSSDDGAIGYNFQSTPSILTITDATLDIDNNGKAKGFTDGFLIIRYLLGARGQTLIDGIVASDSTRQSASEIEQYLNDNKLTILDVDGNGKAKGFTDGFLIIRYLLGARGQTLIDGVVASDATRTTASEIEAFLQSKI